MRNFFYLKKTWTILLLSMIFGLSANATQIPIPSTGDSLLQHLRYYPEAYADGDTIVLVSEEYIIAGTPDVHHTVTIMGDPALGKRPLVKLYDNGFRFKQDSIGIVIKGVDFDGYNPENGKYAPFIVRCETATSDSIFKSIIIEDCNAIRMKGGIKLQKNKNAVYDSVIVNNCIWGDFQGEYVIDPAINFFQKLIVTNSTIYNVSKGFLKNPAYSHEVNGYEIFPKEIIIDHNTFYNIGAGNNAFIQINDPKDSTVTLSFTNNIVDKLYDPANVRPFRLDPSAGTFDFNTNVFHDFMPSNPDLDQYSLDSTAANQTNVTVTNIITDDPQLLDEGDFRLPIGSALFTADASGGQIGDPRWGVFEGVYIYELQEPVYTNNPVQLEAAIAEVGGATAITWEVDTFYAGTRALATIEPTTGLLTPTRAGQVKVTATSDATAIFDTLIVTIQDSIHVTGIQVHAETTVITEEDGDLDIIASLTPNNPTDARVEWSVSDDRIAEINGESNDTIVELVAKVSGTVWVKAISLDADLSDSIEITIAIPGIVAHWKMDETAGTTVADEKIHSEGSLINGNDASWVAGLDGNAIDLSLTDSTCIVVPSNEYNDLDSTVSFTLSALIKVPDFTNNNEILFKGYTSTDETVPGSKGNWIAMSLNERTVRFFIDDNTTKTNLDFSEAYRYLYAGDWNHIVCIRDRALDSLFIFINGEKMASMLDNTELDISSGPLPWVIGGGGKQNALFAGLLDDVMIYNIALSAEEVAAMTSDYAITPIVPLDNDATLSDLQVDGVTVPEFSSGKVAYAVELAAGTTTVPTVTATTTHANASAVVTAATELPGTTTIDVTAEDGFATKAYKIDFTVAPETDGLSNVNASNIAVYPNPATDFIKISVTQQAVVSIHSLVGNVVMYQTLEVGGSIDIQDLESGIYFANIEIKDSLVKTIRFVKE